MLERYQSIFFDDEWALHKHRGWVLKTGRPSMKILEKSCGALKRVLVLCEGADDRAISAALTQGHVFAATSEVIVHDFSSPEAPQRSIGGRTFVLSGDKERLINKATFVINISKSQESLLREMRQGFRQSIKKAVERGVRVEVKEDPTPQLIDDFAAIYDKMARERGLSLIRRSELNQMFRDKSIVMGVASCGGKHLSFALVYISGRKAFYMHGATVSNDDGAGKYLQYELFDYLRSRNVTWYDLGGVPEIDESNGIYLFKKGFGGELVRLGAEFVHRPAIVRGVRTLAKGVRAVVAIRHQ